MYTGSDWDKKAWVGHLWIEHKLFNKKAMSNVFKFCRNQK